MSFLDFISNDSAVGSILDSFIIRNDEVLESFCGIRKLSHAASEVGQHFIKITTCLQQLIERILNPLEKVNSTVSVVNENRSKFYDVIVS